MVRRGATSPIDHVEAARRAMLPDLARSGITNEELINKRFTPLSADEVRELTGHRVLGYIIWYFDIEGKKLDHYSVSAFWSLSTRRQDPKVWQSLNSKSRVYLDPSYDWVEIARSPSRTITLVEGEKKAIALCQAGICAIAISGVWNFGGEKTRHDGPTRDPGANEYGEGRLWEIVFDYDQHRKPQVAAAADNCMRQLVEIGGRPSYVLLPGPENGADDYLKEAWGAKNTRAAARTVCAIPTIVGSKHQVRDRRGRGHP